MTAKKVTNENTGDATSPVKLSRLSTIRGRVTGVNRCEYCLADPKTVLLAISCVQAMGGAIVFGATRDGGSLVVTVLDGPSNEKFYAKNADELNNTLTDIALAFKQDIIGAVYQHIQDEIGVG